MSKIIPPVNPLNFSGINPSRVINIDFFKSLGEIYKCSLCSKIMINPIDCEKCAHSFCYNCISNNNCPFKCEKKILKPSSMGIKNLLEKLIFKCENKGCEEEISYSKVISHDQTCGFLIITCPNENCGKKLCMKDLENHIKNECKYSLKQCKFCKFQFQKNKIKEHKKICSKAYRSLKGDRSVDFEKIDTNEFLQALSMNISRILKDKINNEKNIILNESEDNSNSIVNVNCFDDLKNSIKDEIGFNLKSNFSNFEKNIGNLNNNISEIKTLVTSIKSNNDNIINESNINISKTLSDNEKENIKEIINENNKYIEKLIKKLEKNTKNSLQNLNKNIINTIKELNIIQTEKIKIINNEINEIEKIKKTEIENILKIKDKIIKDNIIYIPEEYFKNKLNYITKLIKETNEKIDIFKLSFSTDIKEYTENLSKFISITATTEQVVTEVEIEEILDENGNVIETREIEIQKDPNRKSSRNLSFVHLNENNFKDLQNNIQKIVDENNKKNFEKIKNMYQKDIGKNDKEYYDYNDSSDDEINDIRKKEKKINEKKKVKKGKRIKKIITENTFNHQISDNIHLNEVINKNKEIINEENEKIIDEVKSNNYNFKMELSNIFSNEINEVSKEMNEINSEITNLKNNIKDIMKIMNEEFNNITKYIKENENEKEIYESKLLNKERIIINNNDKDENKNDSHENINDNNNNLEFNNEIPNEKELIEENKNESNYLRSKRKYKLSKKSRELKSGPSNDEIVKSINEEIPEFEEENPLNEKEKNKNIISEKIIEEENEDNIIEIKENIFKETKYIKSPNKDNNKVNEENNNNLIKENPNNNYSILLNTLENQINSFNLITENMISKKKLENIKYSLLKDYDEKLPIFEKEIEEDLNNKMKSMFSIKYCNECEKIDYFYGFLQCYLCKKNNCKQCIVLCSQCKHLFCKKCGICQKCNKNICINCRENTQNKICENCL